MEHINPPRRRILAASSVLSAAALTGCTPDGLFSRPLGGAPRPSQPGACLPADAARPDCIDGQGAAITPDGPQHDPPDLFRGALDLSGDGALLAAAEQSGTPAAEAPGVILWSTADRALRTRLKHGPTGPSPSPPATTCSPSASAGVQPWSASMVPSSAASSPTVRTTASSPTPWTSPGRRRVSSSPSWSPTGRSACGTSPRTRAPTSR